MVPFFLGLAMCSGVFTDFEAQYSGPQFVKYPNIVENTGDVTMTWYHLPQHAWIVVRFSYWKHNIPKWQNHLGQCYNSVYTPIEVSYRYWHLPSNPT